MSTHAGLLFKVRKPYREYFAEPAQREVLMRALAEVVPDPVYLHAFRRWRASFSAPDQTFVATVASRLVTGLGDKGVFEWGVRLSATYGMPVIPGSGLKGAVVTFARGLGILPTNGPEDEKVADRDRRRREDLFLSLFGDTADGGEVVFHDAWWDPTAGVQPFVPDVMTPHHLDYGTKDTVPPADWDDPTPIQFVAVRGRFLFAVEGPDAALVDLAVNLLKRMLVEQGVGAKTRAGYGTFRIG